MRAWTILFEASLSILFLVISFILVYSYIQQQNAVYSVNYAKYLVDMGRGLSTNCKEHPSYAYVIIDISKGNITVCYYGKKVQYIKGNTVFSYLYYNDSSRTFYILSFIE